MPELLAVCVFFLGSLVQGLSGFGSGLVAMALLPLFIDVREAVAISSVVGVALTISFTIRLWRHVDRREVLPMSLAALVGVPLGVWFLHAVDVRLVTGTLGVVLVVHATWSLLRGARKERQPGQGWGVVAGGLGGALSGAFSTAGPPVLVYATLRAWPKDTFRANLQAFFSVTGLLSLTGFALTGLVTPQTLWVDLLVLPAVACGAWVGHRLSSRVDPIAFRKGVLVALFLMGCNYIVRLAL